MEQPGGKFGFPYPNFTGATGAMNATQFVQKFDSAMHNMDVYAGWIPAGKDIRLLNPSGVYLKHFNLRTIDPNFLLGHPNYAYIHTNHPEWILRDAEGNTVPLFLPSEETLDFGNDDYLTYALNTWMPDEFLDSTDDDPDATMWYLHDNGNFLRQFYDCAPSDEICEQYNSDEGVQTAFKNMFDRFKDRWPNKKILVSTGPLSYMAPSTQLPWFKDVLAHCDGYYSESLTSDHVYWSDQPNNDKRNALNTTMDLADWLADNNKYFCPNLGMGDGQQPTQAETNYGFAFFNLMRRGDKQFYSQVMKNSNGLYQPITYSEMNLPIGQSLEERQQISTNVYRRRFQFATSYVNLSDISVNINLPGAHNTNSLGVKVNSPLVLNSFSGLTVYHLTSPNNLRVVNTLAIAGNLQILGGR